MIAFVLVLSYLTASILSPGAFPLVIMQLHMEIILGVLAIFAVIPSIGPSRMMHHPSVYLLIGLLASVVAGILVTGWIGGAVGRLSGFVPVVITFPFILATCTRFSRLRILVGVLALVALFIFFKGFLAERSGDFDSPYLLVPKASSLVGVIRYRGLGVISDPNDTGQFYLMLLPLLWLYWEPSKLFRNALLTLLPAALLVAGIFSTHSRGALVGLVAMVWFGFRKKLGTLFSSVFATICCVGMLALNLSGGRGINDDDGGRVAAWIAGLEVFKAHPLFGVGMGNFGDFNETGMTAHNSYVLCLAELGILGYFFWMSMIVFAWMGLSYCQRIFAREQVVDDGAQQSGPKMPFSFPGAVSPSAGTVVQDSLGQSHLLAYSGAYGSDPAPIPAQLPSSWMQSAPYASREADDTVQVSDERLKMAAHLGKVSLVGLLTAGYFLSRTYSITLYVGLGVATAIRLIAARGSSEPDFESKKTFKAAFVVILLSVFFLYVFVRVRGVR